jgi:hypothetical protein
LTVYKESENAHNEQTVGDKRGVASYRLAAQWKYVTIVSDGANRLTVANN